MKIFKFIFVKNYKIGKIERRRKFIEGIDEDGEGIKKTTKKDKENRTTTQKKRKKRNSSNSLESKKKHFT